MEKCLRPAATVLALLISSLSWAYDCPEFTGRYGDCTNAETRREGLFRVVAYSRIDKLTRNGETIYEFFSPGRRGEDRLEGRLVAGGGWQELEGDDPDGGLARLSCRFGRLNLEVHGWRSGLNGIPGAEAESPDLEIVDWISQLSENADGDLVVRTTYHENRKSRTDTVTCPRLP